MFKLPFGTLPGHWGLAGKTREIAKAEYELTGALLDLKLLEINHYDYDKDSYRKKTWDIELKYGQITEATYHRYLTELIKDPAQKALAILELDYREGKVKELEYAKQLATLKNEPWVTVLSMEFGGKGALEGSFELDWNEQFVEKLKTAGYVGPTPDNIVNQWFMEVCRNIAMEEFDGTGDFTADSEANLEAMKRWSSESFPEGRKGYK